MPASTNRFRVGLVVNAGPSRGFGHAVRCHRIAQAFHGEAAIYPISETCRRFFEATGMGDAIQDTRSREFPPVMITDLREQHEITDAIREQGPLGPTHISIHDLGLAQCKSDIAIDGSVTNLVPYSNGSNQTLFLGPRYMVTRKPVARVAAANVEDTVLITLGGGASAEFAGRITDQLQPLGIRVVTTAGLSSHSSKPPTPDSEIEHAMATCRFAISAAGTTLYDLLASGVPTIAVALDRLQLRTAEAFQDAGAVLSAGLLDRLSASELVDRCQQLLANSSKVSQMVSTGRDLVDGNGLQRVVEIVKNPGREIWKIHQTETSTVC